jgi:sulfoxide reductase heme-binding subunit YedZ
MSLSLAAVGPSAYWYLARGTGAVALLLLTASVVLGVMSSVRFALAPRWPRFAIDTVHREVSLLVLVLLAIHILTSVLDSFAPIKLTDAVIPFASSYRPLWMGLGALSFDLLLALVITSLLRRRIGYARWRAIHWLAYASWPVAVLHGLGTGSDTKVWWMLALTAGCVAAVIVAVLIRIARSERAADSRRGLAVALALATPIALALFTLVGPLQPGWARRAGTPTRLLAHHTAAATGASARVRPTPATRATLKAPFSARLDGSITQRNEAGGAILDLALRLSGGAHGSLRVRLAGAPVGGGGLSLTGSQVDLLADGLPAVMQGKIVSLEGQHFDARVAGAGSALDLHAELNIDQGSGSVTGTVSATRARGA